ncbi:MAG: Crp/Fnr family transcriptional regulator [Desulfosudaceae bacterium]
MTTATTDLIRTLPLFKGLEAEHIDNIAGISETRTFHKGEIVFSEGDLGNGFYIIETGRVKIYKLSLEGKEHIFHIYGPGKPFGEVPVFQGSHFPATAQALESSRLVFLPRREFVGLITAHPSLAMNMLAVLSMRLREFTVMVENLALKEVPARLAAYLLVLAEEQDNNNTVTLPVSKNQLAGLIGTTPETISRTLTKMAGDDVIQVSNRDIVLRDMESLVDMSEAG